MEKTISIIVPVYNAQNTLHRCVSSLTGQSYENLEILLVNDGSKDGSLAVCRELAQKDGRIRVINKPNGGVSSARNAGLDAAQGEYIMFCDSDDWVHRQWCEIMLRNQIPDGMTVCQISHGGADSEKTGSEEKTEIVGREVFLHYPAVMSSPVNKIYQRSVIQSHDLRFSTELRLGEDFAFVLNYLCKIRGQVCFLPQKLYYYDTSTEGSLSKRSATIAQCDLFYRMITASMEELGATDPESIYNRDWHVMTQFENMLIAAAENEKLSFSQKMKLAKETENMDSFRTVNSRVITWANPFYLWLLEKKYARWSMLYLILRTWKAKGFACIFSKE